MTGWPLVPLGEVLLPTSRPESVIATEQYRLLGAHWYAEGLYIKDIKAGSEIQANQLYRVECGDFVYNRLFAWKGSFALAGKDVHGCYVSNEFPCFRLREVRVDGRYLHYYFSRESIWSEALGLSSGSTPTSRNRLKEDRLLAMTVPLPPIEEQRRIVVRIEALAKKHDLARRLRVAATMQVERISDSYIEALFGAADQRGWKHYRLGDFVTEARYGTSEKTTDDTSGTPVLRMGNIQDGELDIGDLKYLHLSDVDKATLLLKHGDIVVNRTNSAELVGKCATFRLEGDFAYASYLIRLRIDTNRAIPELLATYINSGAGRAYMFAERKQMTGQANVNAQKLKMLPLRLPGLDEQVELLKGITQIRSFMKRIRAQQILVGKQLEALLPSILNQAFSALL
jgi:type I restriction enzyme S subunit